MTLFFKDFYKLRQIQLAFGTIDLIKVVLFQNVHQWFLIIE